MTLTHTAKHRLFFEANREDSWPESMPWPGWKPGTDKSFRPDSFTFEISWVDGENVNLPSSGVISGPRINKGGNLGVGVREEYWGDALRTLPLPFRELLNEGFIIAERAKKQYKS